MSADGRLHGVDGTLKAINTVGILVMLAVMSWVAHTTVQTREDVATIAEQVRGFRAEQKHVERRIDQHDKAFDKYSMRIRVLEHRLRR